MTNRHTHRRWPLVGLVLVLLLVVSVLPVAPLAPTALAQTISEAEPNDMRAQANTLVSGRENAVTNARVSPTNDLDYFKFDVEGGRTYVIETFNVQVTSSREGTGLWLYNDTGTLLADDDSSVNGTGDANARITYTFQTAGTYYILVSDERFSTWTGTYSLRILPRHDESGSSWDSATFEPNDALPLAYSITPGRETPIFATIEANIGLLNNNTDLDFYRFRAEAGRTYVIETFNVQATSDGEGSGLWLYNDTGTLLADDDGSANGTGDANARITYTFRATGTYYILVSDERFGTWTGTYSLRILPRHDEPGSSWNPANFEPNDALPLAYNITPGLNNAITASLENYPSLLTNGRDLDFYRFQVEAGRTFVFETYNVQRSTNSDGTGLWLYSDGGVVLANDEGGRAGTGPADARIVYTFTTGGTYYLLVTDERFGNWSGSYSLRILARYDEPGAARNPADDEPNDTMALADELPLGEARSRQISPNTGFVFNTLDRDYYRVQAQAGQRLTIETFNVQQTGGNVGTGMYLFNSQGEVIANDESGSARTGSADARISYSFTTAGIYYVRVQSQRFSEWTGPYSIRVCAGECTTRTFVYLPLLRR